VKLWQARSSGRQTYCFAPRFADTVMYHLHPTPTHRVTGSPPQSPALQDTLDALRQAMKHTGIMCAVMLDTKVRRTWM